MQTWMRRLAYGLALALAAASQVSQAEAQWSTGAQNEYWQSLTAKMKFGAHRYPTASKPACPSVAGLAALGYDTTIPAFQVCEAGGWSTVATGGSGITIGTTTITGGTTTRILYDTAGVVGEYTLTGSGTVVAMATSPTFVTDITVPTITAGVAAASPTALSIAAGSSRSGTDTNTAGANFTVKSGVGTGTATGSSFIVQVPLTVGSGTGAQTLTTGLTVKASGATAVESFFPKNIYVGDSGTYVYAGAQDSTGLRLGSGGTNTIYNGSTSLHLSTNGQTIYLGKISDTATGISVNSSTGLLTAQQGITVSGAGVLALTGGAGAAQITEAGTSTLIAPTFSSTAGSGGLQVAGATGVNGDFASYGTAFGGTRFGSNLAGGTFISVYGSGSTVLGVGTITSDPIVFGTNDTARLTLGATGVATFATSLAIPAGTSTGSIAKPGGTIAASTTSTGNTAATDTSLWSFSVPANTLATNLDTLRFQGSGTFGAGVSADKTATVKYGSTTICTTGALAVTSGSWLVEGWCSRTGAATQVCTCVVEGGALTPAPSFTSPTETLSGAVTFDVRGSGTNANDIVFKMGYLSWQSAP